MLHSGLRCPSGRALELAAAARKVISQQVCEEIRSWATADRVQGFAQLTRLHVYQQHTSHILTHHAHRALCITGNAIRIQAGQTACQKQNILFHAVEARAEEPEPARLHVAWRGQQLQGAHDCIVTASPGRLAGHG